MSTDKVRRLGRGLDALMKASPKIVAAEQIADERPGRATAFQTIAVAAIVPNPLQPRKEFKESELQELRSSIEASGLLQPLLVRPRGKTFELIAGERRFRAVQSLGWHEVPAHVRELDDKDVLTLALIENLQRSDLDPIEEAQGYQELSTRFSLTQQEIANAVGKQRSTIANMLRLLTLPESVRTMLRTGDLTLGHARALLGLASSEEMSALAGEARGGRLTVRDVERRVRRHTEGGRQRKRTPGPGEARRPPEVRLIEEQIRRRYQTDAKVLAASDGKGEIRIAFYSTDDLERLLDLLLGAAREAL